MSMMGGGNVGPTTAGPLQQLAQLRMQQGGPTPPPPQPVGPNQGVGAPTLGAPPAQHPMGSVGPATNAAAQDVLAEMGRASVRGGDQAALGHHIRELQKMYPKLLMAKHENGRAELVGPAHEQFLAAAYGRANGAKVAHVRNNGSGQRLHLEF